MALASGSASVAVAAPAVLIAGGGSGGLYAVTTNPPRIRGEGLGMAARAGAVIADAEFVQFHPTALACGADPAPLATEALRGEGAHLVNAAGDRFRTALHPDPRDIVARGVYAESQAGRQPALDCCALGDRIRVDFPAVASACARAGIDPLRQPISIAVAAHYHMGGIATESERAQQPARALGLRRGSLDGLARRQPAGFEWLAGGCGLCPTRRPVHRPGRAAGRRGCAARSASCPAARSRSGRVVASRNDGWCRGSASCRRAHGDAAHHPRC